MQLENKNILVIGLAKTGVSTLKYLQKLKANILVNDIKKESELTDILKELEGLNNITYILGEHMEDVSNIDLAVVSPGVPLDLPFINKIRDNNIEIIGEIELAYRVFNSKNSMPNIVAITGTNGKTTTTSLTGELFNNAKRDTHIVGNIGAPMIDIVDSINNDSVVVAELSSFQLESIESFKPSISMILNITPDHLNRHHTIDNYIEAKARIYENQCEKDAIILNYDDIHTRMLGEGSSRNIYYFSTNYDLRKSDKKGIFVDSDGHIIIHMDKTIQLMHKSRLSLPGEHNLQNSIAGALAGYLSNIELETIVETLSTFAGVEHRQEFVKEINRVAYINDSKGTNPDSTIKALNSYERPIILIAGGIDKKSDFTQLSKEIVSKTKALVLLGETASQIMREVQLAGYEKIICRVENMEEAVKISSKLSQPNDIVLLSPACASWDMYKNFEERGNEFKTLVKSL